MQEELKRQRIKGLIEVGGAADEALQPTGISDCRWMGHIERYLYRRPLLKITVAGAVAMSVVHSAWTLVTAALE